MIELAASASRQPKGATVPAALYSGIATYYNQKADEFGATPYGVDWTCVATQELRFVQLIKVCDSTKPFSINDLGCGYGALLAYLKERRDGPRVDYCGVDLSASLVSAAQDLWGDQPDVQFHLGGKCPRIADYALASGLFNVRLAWSLSDWETFVQATLQELDQSSKAGFAANFMRGREGQLVREGLYATTPEPWVDYCTAQFGGAVRVIEDYGLREFTLLVDRRRGT